MKNRKLNFLILIITFLVSCQEHKTEFKSYQIDRTKDLFENLSKNLNPDESYTYWAFLRSTHGIGNATILNERGNIDQRELLNLRFNLSGFFSWGHHADIYYYILAVKDGEVFKVDTKENLLTFLDKIDTKEEAFLIARINEFLIDNCLSQGNSYRRVKNGYELLLIGPDSYSEGYINYDLKRTQHFVTINHKGELSTRLIGVYCEGDEECICD